VRTNLSKNSLLGTGDKFNKVDEANEKGLLVDFTVDQFMKAIYLERNEFVLVQYLW
jgi:hypothetical protein